MGIFVHILSGSCKKMNRNTRTYRQSLSNGIPVFIIMIPLIFAVVGVILLINFINQKAENDRFMETAVPVNATCTDVWSETSGSRKHRKTSYYADVKFTYEGITYHVDRIKVNRNTKVGNEITLYTQPSNPRDARLEYTTGDFVGSVVMSCAFIVMGLIASGVLISTSNRTKREMAASANRILSAQINGNNNYNNGYQNNSSPNTTYQSYNGYDNYYQNNSSSSDYQSYNGYDSYSQSNPSNDFPPPSTNYQNNSYRRYDSNRENNAFYSGNIFDDSDKR